MFLNCILDFTSFTKCVVITFIFLSDVIDMDELKGRISNLNLAVFKKVPTKSVETIPSLIRHADQERHTGRDNLETMKPSHASDTEHIILLSDSEENLPTDAVIVEEVLSSVKENDGFTASDLLKNHSVQRMPLKLDMCP